MAANCFCVFNFVDQLWESKRNKTVEISLSTIQCGMCSNKIADGLNKLDGVNKIDVDLEKRSGLLYIMLVL